jgi:Sjoegren syndrome nuclear autoantigen 1
VKSLEGLRERRDNILIDIKKEEEKKNEIEKIIEKIQIELENLNEHLQRKIEIRNEFERVIQNTEGAYFKVKKLFNI